MFLRLRSPSLSAQKPSRFAQLCRHEGQRVKVEKVHFITTAILFFFLCFNCFLLHTCSFCLAAMYATITRHIVLLFKSVIGLTRKTFITSTVLCLHRFFFPLSVHGVTSLCGTVTSATCHHRICVYQCATTKKCVTHSILFLFFSLLIYSSLAYLSLFCHYYCHTSNRG